MRYADEMGNLKYEAAILAAAYREKCEELAREKETYAKRIAREYPKKP